jgi:hypothetical protein
MTYDLGVIKRQKYFGPPTPSAASGGLLSYYTLGTSTYAVHTFVSSGVFKLAQPINTAVTASVLVVAGGGGGGAHLVGSSNAHGGGGGAGGLLTTSSFVFSNTLTYVITVGSGGAGGPGGTVAVTSTVAGNAANGTNSTIVAAVTTYYNAIGGGFGGGGVANNNATAIGDGGSGGGGTYANFTGDIGAGTAGQGNNGGPAGTSISYSSGGGGAGAAGIQSSGASTGGIGVISTITGSSVYYAGGGSGANTSITTGGAGGGGQGSATGTAAAGIQNGTRGLGGGGGGGGGAASSTVARAGGNGGSGVVIISYPITLPASTFNDPDPYFNRVVALIQDTTGDLQPTHITDSSLNNIWMQPTSYLINNILPSFYNPFSTNDSSLGSTYFDGTSTNQCLTNATSTSSFAFGTNDFTIECWVNASTKASTSPVIIGSYATTLAANTWALHLDRTSSANKFSFYAFNGTLVLVGATSINLRQWNHIAIVRGGNTINMYLNGVLDATSSYTQTLNVAGTSYKIYIANAGGSDAATWFNGYISNLRISNNTAIYTGNFAPINAPLTVVQAGSSNITALTGYNTTFLSLQTSVPSNNSRFINATSSTQVLTVDDYPAWGSYTPYGRNWSMGFNATMNMWVAANTTDTSLIIGTSDFTIESWIHIDADLTTQYFPIIARLDSAGTYGVGSWGLGLVPNAATGQGVMVFNNGVSDFFTASTTISGFTWHHVAVTRQGTTLNAWLDGALYATTTTSVTNLNGVGEIRIGRTKDATNSTLRSAYGHISNCRVVVGDAVYKSAFVPSAFPLAAISSGTVVKTLLLTCQNSRLQDNSGNNFTMSVPNATSLTGVVSSRFSPFPNQPYNKTVQGVVGSSIYFNQWSIFSSPDTIYLDTANTASNLRLTGDFTIEFWVNCANQEQGSALDTDGLILSRNQAYASTSTFSFLISSSNFGHKLLIRTGNPITTVLTSLSYIPNQIWHHIAVTRKNGTVSLYVDGIQEVNTINTSTWDYSNISIGSNRFSATDGYSGYLCDFRIINGRAIDNIGSTQQADYLVVAGGGGGGRVSTSPATTASGGAGGAGGYVSSSISLRLGIKYVVTVGAGGAGGNVYGFPSQDGDPGSNSSLSGLEATGGGAGGASASPANAGNSGGSGGGGSGSYGAAGGAGGAGVAGQGNSGGSGAILNSGGGGGAGSVGGNAVSNISGGNGGAGQQWLNGSYYAGGGGGGARIGTAGLGGIGGGGNGSTSTTAGISATPNTGGGGGGGVGAGAGVAGGSGGSGIVIVRHPDALSTGTITGGGTASASIGGYIYYTFTASGTFVLGNTVNTVTPPQTALRADANTQTVFLLRPTPAIIELSGKTNPILYGDAVKSLVVTKYGSSSIYLDGTVDNILILDDNGNGGDSVAPYGDFTVEMWIYNTAAAGTSRRLISKGYYSASGWGFAVNSSGVWGSFSSSESETAIPTAATAGLNTWQHVAVVRASNYLYLYVNGVPIYYVSYTGYDNDVDGYYIGPHAATSNLGFQGYIDGIRITKGVARYTGQFTPPTQAFPTR